MDPIFWADDVTVFLVDMFRIFNLLKIKIFCWIFFRNSRQQRYRNSCIGSSTYSVNNRSRTPSAVVGVSWTTRASTLTGSDKNATMVLIIIVIVFVVCETPELALKFLTFSERNFGSRLLSRQLLFWFNVISELLMVVNSSANFVVYLVFGRRFRRILRETFRFSFPFSSHSTASTHDAAAPVLQYHHNCIHTHSRPALMGRPTPVMSPNAIAAKHRLWSGRATGSRSKRWIIISGD